MSLQTLQEPNKPNKKEPKWQADRNEKCEKSEPRAKNEWMKNEVRSEKNEEAEPSPRKKKQVIWADVEQLCWTFSLLFF